MQKNENKSGLLYGLATFSLWGIFPIYFKLLNSLSYLEIVAHRIIWSVILLIILLKFTNKLKQTYQILKNKKTALSLLLTGILITSNWTIYVYGVEAERIVDTSLGYFINPFFNMILGVLVLREKLSTSAKIATIIVMIAIGVQIYDAGGLPFISLILPTTFAFYSLIRKKINVPSLEGLLAETIFVLPFAIAAIFYTSNLSTAHFGFSWFGVLIALSGPATVLPLLLFNEAAKRLKLSTIGYLQYISPSLQLLIAILIYNESVGELKLISFGLIWIALGIVTLTSIRKGK